jgi:hypothetical protein
MGAKAEAEAKKAAKVRSLNIFSGQIEKTLEWISRKVEKNELEWKVTN